MSDNAIVLATVDTALSADAGTMICSIENNGDRAQQAKIFNALNEPDHRIADFINKEITVKDVLIEIRDILNEETGEIARVPRVVLISPDGTSYQATSVGIFNSVKNAFHAFGVAPWDPALTFEIKQKPVKNGSMLTAVVRG